VPFLQTALADNRNGNSERTESPTAGFQSATVRERRSWLDCTASSSNVIVRRASEAVTANG
jgi:hypothetical protein